MSWKATVIICEGETMVAQNKDVSVVVTGSGQNVAII